MESMERFSQFSGVFVMSNASKYDIQQDFNRFNQIQKEAHQFLKDKQLLALDLGIMRVTEHLGTCGNNEIFSFFEKGVRLLGKGYTPTEKALASQISTLRTSGYLEVVETKNSRHILQLSDIGKKICAEFSAVMDSKLAIAEQKPKTSSEEGLKSKVQKLLDTIYLKELNQLAGKYPNVKSFYVDFELLESADSDLADDVRKDPGKFIATVKEDISGRDIITEVKFYEEKKFAPNVRIKKVPTEYKTTVAGISPDRIQELVVFDGTIVSKDLTPHCKLDVGRFKCNRCTGPEIDEPQHPYKTEEITKPIRCKECGYTDLTFLPDASKWINISPIEIQENIEAVETGKQAQSIKIVCLDDLCNVADVGDRVCVTGILVLQPPQKKGSLYIKYVIALSVERTETDIDVYNPSKDELKQIKTLAKDPLVYDKLIDSVAPSVYGLREVKEALILQAFGGRRNKINSEGGKERSESHILLMGDPSVAKSKLMGSVSRLVPKRIFASGKGASGCGLTASVMKDELSGRFVVKAGALVLANGGLLVVDEFDKMHEDDRTRMHEGMEQQIVSVTKAGIVARMKCETTVLAAANPTLSRFDPYKPFSQQFNLPASLLSRFDLIFILLDKKDKDLDRKIANKILKNHSFSSENEAEEDKPPVSLDLLRKYVAYARANINPILTNESSQCLANVYVKLRAASGDAMQITARQLEGLVRLAEASAKARLSDSVDVKDVERVVRIYTENLRQIASDPVTGEIDIDLIFSDNSTRDRARYKLVEQIFRENCDKDDGISIATLLTRCAEKKIETEEARSMITKLKQNKTIYEPRHNTLKLLEGGAL
jgi:replicative DNA helicase Mcm